MCRGVITAAAPGDYDTGVQLAFPAPAGNATLAPVGPPVGPQQIPAVATANATLAPVNATSALANATAPAASASVPVTNATLLAGNNTVASVVPIAAPNATEPAALSAPAVAAPGPAAAANPTTTLALPGELRTSVPFGTRSGQIRRATETSLCRCRSRQVSTACAVGHIHRMHEAVSRTVAAFCSCSEYSERIKGVIKR